MMNTSTTLPTIYLQLNVFIAVLEIAFLNTRCYPCTGYRNSLPILFKPKENVSDLGFSPPIQIPIPHHPIHPWFDPLLPPPQILCRHTTAAAAIPPGDQSDEDPSRQGSLRHQRQDRSRGGCAPCSTPKVQAPG